MNIPPPILEKICNQGGDDDADDHKHEDPYTQCAWKLILMDHLFLYVYWALLMLLRKQVLSPMVALSGPIPTSRCRVFGMDTSVLAPTPSPWFSIESLGGNSLFLGQNYPMMVKADPAAVDTTLLLPLSHNIRVFFTLV